RVNQKQEAQQKPSRDFSRYMMIDRPTPKDLNEGSHAQSQTSISSSKPRYAIKHVSCKVEDKPPQAMVQYKWKNPYKAELRTQTQRPPALKIKKPAKKKAKLTLINEMDKTQLKKTMQ
ncbi:hypothetical protein BGZ49_000524, partial [Haplosporangium sp. Z 27]